MIADDSYSGSIVSILNISCDVSRYNIHDYCLSGSVSSYSIHDYDLCWYVSRYCIALCVFPFFCVLCSCCCTRASLVLFGRLSNTRVSPDVLSQDSLSKVFNVETSQLEGIPCHEWWSVLLGSTQLSLLVSTRWEPGSFPCCRPGWKPGILAVCIWTSLVVCR